jgi:glutaredoxin 3
MTTLNLTLYSGTHCPYCKKVTQYMAEAKINIPIKKIDEDPAYAAELIKMGGKRQIPCLMIDGNALYESNDIIQWLKENYSNET